MKLFPLFQHFFPKPTPPVAPCIIFTLSFLFFFRTFFNVGPMTNHDSPPPPPKGRPSDKDPFPNSDTCLFLTYGFFPRLLLSPFLRTLASRDCVLCLEHLRDFSVPSSCDSVPLCNHFLKRTSNLLPPSPEECIYLAPTSLQFLFFPKVTRGPHVSSSPPPQATGVVSSSGPPMVFTPLLDQHILFSSLRYGGLGSHHSFSFFPVPLQTCFLRQLTFSVAGKNFSAPLLSSTSAPSFECVTP